MMSEGSETRRRTGTILVLAALLAAGCAVGDFNLAANRTRRGDVALGVGNVSLGRGATLTGGVTLKAGNVTAAAGARIGGPVDVRNGNVELGDSVSAVALAVGNGLIRLGRGARVTGAVGLSNGLIDLDGGRVDGPVSLVRGRLEARAGSLLAGGVRVDNPSPLPGDSTIVIIRNGAAVRGAIAVEGHARLVIEAGADTAGVRLGGSAPRPHE
jgi:hypothetical protein